MIAVINRTLICTQSNIEHHDDERHSVLLYIGLTHQSWESAASDFNAVALNVNVQADMKK